MIVQLWHSEQDTPPCLAPNENIAAHLENDDDTSYQPAHIRTI